MRNSTVNSYYKQISAKTPSTAPTGVPCKLKVRSDDSSIQSYSEGLDKLNTEMFENNPGPEVCENVKDTIDDLIAKAKAPPDCIAASVVMSSISHAKRNWKGFNFSTSRSTSIWIAKQNIITHCV